MATVVKDFKIKSGLVVEGTTGKINNFDILTKKQADQDYIVSLIGGTATSANTADTVVKRDSSGNFAAGTVTVNSRLNIGSIGYIEEDADDLLIANTDGNDVVLQGEDIRLNATDDVRLNAGTGGDVVIASSTGQIRLEGPSIYAGENLSYVDSERVATRGYVDAEIDAIDLTFTTDDVTEGTNRYFTEERVDDHLSGTYPIEYDAGAISLALGTGGGLVTDEGGLYVNRTVVDTWYDENGAAAAAQTAAEATASADATSKANDAEAAAILAAAGDATTKANAAQSAAEDYADGLAVNYDVFGAAAAAQTAAEAFATQAVADLVDGAPAVLDTLNELAAALQDNPDVITNIQNVAAGKQDTLTPGANIDITGATISVTGLDTDDVSEGSNLYFSDFRAQEAVSDVLGTGLNYGDQGDGNVFHVDENHISTKAYAESVADTAYENAQDYAELKASDAQAAAIETASQDATTKANNAQSAAEDYADGLAVNYDAFGSAATAEQNAKDYADALDTDDIQEGSSNLYHTDVRAKDAAADLLTSATKTNITITGTGSGLTITAENGVADSDTDDLDEGENNLYFTDNRAIGALQGTEPVFQTVSIDEVALQVASTLEAATAGVQTAYAWGKSAYRSAEFLVKVAYGTHTEISKVLLTLDTSDNIAITEYGIVGTNGSASTVSAGISGNDVQLLVTTNNNTSTVTVVGTLLA